MDDIGKAIAKAEAFDEEWVVVLYDENGRKRYVLSGGGATLYRGSAARFDSEATALERAREIRQGPFLPPVVQMGQGHGRRAREVARRGVDRLARRRLNDAVIAVAGATPRDTSSSPWV